MGVTGGGIGVLTGAKGAWIGLFSGDAMGDGGFTGAVGASLGHGPQLQPVGGIGERRHFCEHLPVTRSILYTRYPVDAVKHP
jgi:hypothetical protein